MVKLFCFALGANVFRKVPFHLNIFVGKRFDMIPVSLFKVLEVMLCSA